MSGKGRANLSKVEKMSVFPCVLDRAFHHVAMPRCFTMHACSTGEGSATKVVTQAQILFGMGLIVMSQAVQAAQLTFEDFFMVRVEIAVLLFVGECT